MMRLIAEPLTSAAFLAFGDVLEAPAMPGRTHFEDALANRRPQARPSLSIVVKAPVAGLPIPARVMERHRFSSQSFIPQQVGRWLIVVAPPLAGGEAPDMARARCFLARGDQGVTYGADVWHHPLTVLDKVARFAVLMWRDGSAEDEQFVDVAPFAITLD
jgi:ureidoglycolate lyase